MYQQSPVCTYVCGEHIEQGEQDAMSTVAIFATGTCILPWTVRERLTCFPDEWLVRWCHWFYHIPFPLEIETSLSHTSYSPWVVLISLTQPGVTWEEAASVEELLQYDLPYRWRVP